MARRGTAEGAEELAGSDGPELAATFSRLSLVRNGLGSPPSCRPWPGRTATRSRRPGRRRQRCTGAGWLFGTRSLDPDRDPLKTVVQGEDHEIEAYEEAQSRDISGKTQTVARRQLGEVQAARMDVRGLLETTDNEGDGAQQRYRPLVGCCATGS